MSTTCFISNGSGKFKIAELPKEVQYSPVYTINQMDFNSDGKADLLLCGNNSHTKIRLGKFDANYGILLAGDGKGNFSYINQSESGFNIWGDVRSCIQINDKIYFGINGKNINCLYLVETKEMKQLRFCIKNFYIILSCWLAPFILQSGK